MSNTYVTSVEFKNLLKSICAFQTLTTRVYIPDANGLKKECSVFYKMRIEGSLVTLEGFVVNTTDLDNGSYEIVAEEEFMTARNFWVGDPKQVYTDYLPTSDKRAGSLVWVAAYDRETLYAKFFVNLNDPIVNIKFSIKQLEKLNADAITISRTTASSNQAGVLNTTLNDSPSDPIPKDASPTGM
jgi:hypothetical protein